MASSARVEKLERLRLTLEAEYLRVLLAALEECAGGRWGLFHQGNQLLLDRMTRRWRSALHDQLEKAGLELADVRSELGYVDEFAPMKRLRELRAARGANAPGEPKLAASFIKELIEDR